MKQLVYLAWLMIPLASSLVTAQQARDWTNNEGRSVRATFVRIHDQQAVFKKAGQFVTVPLADLSEEDRDFALALSQLQERRDWLRGEDQVNGRFRGYGDGRVRVQVGAKLVELRADDLTPTNLGLVRAWARAFGKDDGKIPEIARDPEIDAGPEAPEMAVDTMAEFGWHERSAASSTRRWTSTTAGQTVASFVRVQGSKVVLQREGNEFSVPISSLSSADQEYLRGLARQANGEPTSAAATPRESASGESAAGESAAERGPHTDIAGPDEELQILADPPTFDDAFQETVDALMKADPPNLDQEEEAERDDSRATDSPVTDPLVESRISEAPHSPAAPPPEKNQAGAETSGISDKPKTAARSADANSTEPESEPGGGFVIWLLEVVLIVLSIVVGSYLLLKLRHKS